MNIQNFLEQRISKCLALQIIFGCAFMSLDFFQFIGHNPDLGMEAKGVLYLVSGLGFSFATGTKRYCIKMLNKAKKGSTLSERDANKMEQVVWITLVAVFAGSVFFVV